MQADLFSRASRFDSGVELTPADHQRLTGQIERVYNVLRHGHWFTVPGVARITGDPENSVAAQVRNLRKARFGGYQIERRRIGNYYEFRLVSHDAR